MKKIIALILALVLVFSMTACGDNGGSDETTKLTIMSSPDWVFGSEKDLAAKFTEETGIEIEYQITPGDQYLSTLMTKLNTGEATDLYYFQSDEFVINSTLNAKKNAAPLSDEAWTENLIDLYLPGVSVDGTIYGQPIYDLTVAYPIVYNKDIFAELGLEIPTTYEEFMAVCAKIQEAGILPIYETAISGWHQTLWLIDICSEIEQDNPGTIEKLNKNEIKFADIPEFKTLVEQIKSVYDAGYWGTPDAYASNAWPDVTAKFAAGEFAMAVDQPGNKIPQGDNVGYFLIPLIDNDVINVSPAGPTRFVNAKSENQDAAKQFLAFMAKEENVNYMIEQETRLTTLPYEGAINDAPEAVQEFMGMYDTFGSGFQYKVTYVNAQWSAIDKGIAAVLQGQQSVDDFIKAIDKERTNQAEIIGDPAWN